MFKEITKDRITAAETKKRILAYAYCQSESKLSSTKSWRGSLETYTLNLRLSGVYGEKPTECLLTTNRDYQVSSAKYLYLASEIFIQETQNLNPQEFVKLVYQTFLGREADPGGFATNLQQLQTGKSRLNLVSRIRNSEESQSFFLDLTDCLNDQSFCELVLRIYLYPNQDGCNVSDQLFSNQGEIIRSQIIQYLQQCQQLQVALEWREQDFALEDTSFLRSSKQLTNEDFIRQLYLIYLKREADQEGLQRHVSQLESGRTRNQVLYNLRTSTEAMNTFVNLTSDLNNIMFIELAYRIYYKTQLSLAQKQNDLKKLESGLTRQTILSIHHVEQAKQRQDNQELDNQEHISPVVSDRSEPDQEKVMSEGDRSRISQKWQIKNLEFMQRTDNLNNSEFIHQVYQFFLLRNVEQTELEVHKQQLEQDISRLDLLNQVRRSTEAANLFIKGTQELDHEQFLDTAYRIYFHQQLDPEDKLVYLQFLNRGNPRSDILN